MLLDLCLLFDYWLCLIVLCVCCDYLGYLGLFVAQGFVFSDFALGLCWWLTVMWA